MRRRDRGKIPQTSDTAEVSAYGLTRRELVKVGAGVLVLAGTNACSSSDHDDRRDTLYLLRADDLLSLRVRLDNLHIDEGRYSRPARLVRTVTGAPAGVTIELPGQHIAEQAYPDGGSEPVPVDLPAASFLAGTSRLMFRLPAGVDEIDLTLDVLLDVDSWETEITVGSSIELPAGLSLSPAAPAKWHHARKPVTHNGRTELWHTNLSPLAGPAPLTMNIGEPARRSPALAQLSTSLSEEERDQLVGRQAEARLLVLSSLGGWLDISGAWPGDAALTRWEHRATAGQDQHVLVEHAAGYLVPFGHPATLIKVTDRELSPARAGDGGERTAALLRQHFFIVIKEPVQDYVAGDMPFQQLTTTQLVTPPLQGATPTAGPFWVRTEVEDPFQFRFASTDWAGQTQHFGAPAVFVTQDGGFDKALELYGQEPDYQRCDLHGAATVVAPFLPAKNPLMNNWGEPIDKQRSEGDTQLTLLQLKFDARLGADAEPPFRCTASAMQVALPSLEAYLPVAANRGWFELLDPDADGNKGEVFAKALPEAGTPIPMGFENQADRCGGLATPSFTVDGISRVLGPIGDAEAIRTGAPIDFSAYFTGAARLLGGFDLATLLPATQAGASPAVPSIEFGITRKQPKDDEDEDDEDDPKPADDKPTPPAEISLALKWSIGLGTYRTPLVSFVSREDDKGKLVAKLSLQAKLAKKLGESREAQNASGTDPDADAAAADTEKSKQQPASSGVSWEVAGKVSDFLLSVSAFGAAGLDIDFDYLGIKLGPSKPAKKEEDNPEPQPKDDDKKKQQSAVNAEIEYRIARVRATNLLAFVNPLFALASRLPKIPDLETAPPSATYPAKLPSAGGADLAVTVGPIEAPKFELIGFEVSQASATVGIGLNFFPRPNKSSPTPVVPPNIFTIDVASADKPARVVSGQWGGMTHLGVSFTVQRLVGFQFGLGLLYRAKIDLGVTKADCEGSLTAVFTYIYKESEDDLFQLAFIFRLSGKARLYGAIDIYLGLVAVAAYEGEVWNFVADITVRVKIAFFSVSATLRFQHQVRPAAKSSGLLVANELGNDALAQSDWLRYRQAFAAAPAS